MAHLAPRRHVRAEDKDMSSPLLDFVNQVQRVTGIAPKLVTGT